MEPRQNILELYQHLLQLFALLGITLMPNETATEFSKRASSVDEFLKLYNFEEVTQLFVIAKYSNHVMTEADKKRAIQIFEAYLLHFKSKCKKVKYIIYYYILGNL